MLPTVLTSVNDNKKPNVFIKTSANEINLKSLTKPRLLELLDRQNELIKSPLLKKLPDKGEKVKQFKTCIESELEIKNKSLDVSVMFSDLKIDENNVNLMEWGEQTDKISLENEPLNVDNIERKQNPFNILATHSGTNFNKIIIEHEKEDKPLITLEEIEEVYALNLSNKIDKTVTSKEKFLPHKTLIANSSKKSSKVMDLSLVPQPSPVFVNSKMISLEESVKLQFEQTKVLKELQLKFAAMRLKENLFTMGNSLPSGESIKKYRNTCNEQDNESDKESIDNDDV